MNSSIDLACNQILFAVSDLKLSRNFYVDMLGLMVVEEHPRMFAFRAGAVRFSVFEGGRKKEAGSDENETLTIMFRTESLETTVQELTERGVKFSGEIEEAPGFMKHITLLDPDNNLLYIAEYQRDPLQTQP